MLNNTKAFHAPAIADKLRKSLRPATVLWLAVTAALALTVFALAFMTPRSMDDYYYATFWNDGLSAFLRNFSDHYQTMNGRTFIHAVLTVVLRGGTALFGLVSVGLAVAIPFWGHKVTSPDASPLPTIAAFLAGLLLTPKSLMVQGVLWQSAYFNYVFPTAMIVLLLYLFQRVAHAERLKPLAAVGVMVYAFLCGATTEQSGLLAVCAVLAVCAEYLFVNRKRLWLPLTCLFTAAAGVYSVFLSPATQARFQRESNAPLWPVLCRGFTSQAQLMRDEPMLLALLALLFLLLAFFCAARWGGLLAPVFLSLLPLSALLGVLLGGEESVLPLYVALLAVMLGAGVFLWVKGARPLGVLLALAVGSLLVIAATQSSDARTVTPFYLYVITALSCCLGALWDGKWKPLGCVCVAVLVVAGAAHIGYHMPHYVYNYTIEQHNRAAERKAHTTNVLWYDIDYHMDYTHSKPITNSFCRQYYLPSVDLNDDDCQLFFYSSALPRVFLEDQQLELPAIPDENGKPLIPLRPVIEGLGGTVDWTLELTTIRLDGKEALLTFDGHLLSLSGTDSNGNPCTFNTYYDNKYYPIILPLEAYETIFSIHASYVGEDLVLTR